MYTTTLLVSALFGATVLAHGNITSPPARQPGPAMAQACGNAAVSAILADGTGPLGMHVQNHVLYHLY